MTKPILPLRKTLGAGLVTLSAAIFGLAGAMTKLIHADALTVTCWRGLVGGILIGLYVIVRRRSSQNSLRLGRRGWAMAIVGAAASAAFITAFKLSFVANVTIIYATIPFAAALLSWLVIGERLHLRTLSAAAVSIAGVAFMMAAGFHGGNSIGNLAAIVMTLLSAIYIVMIRMFQGAPAVWAGAVSGFLLFALGWLVTNPMSLSGYDALLVVLFGISFAIASVCWTEGARLIPAAESALLGVIEVPCGILYAFILLGEVPPLASIVGGLLVVGAVVFHAVLDWREGRVQTPLLPQLKKLKKI